jgi:hypothetical protein
VIALLRNLLKAMVPLEGTCKPKEEEVIRKEMVAEFALLPQKQRVMFGRKAIKNYPSCICHRQKVQVRSAGEGSKWKSEQGDVSTRLGIEEEGKGRWSTQTLNEVFQVQCMDAMQQMVRWCQGAWASVRESFALLDKAVGGALSLPGKRKGEQGR